MVLLESVVSGHQLTMIRERLGDKIELVRYDPYSKFNGKYILSKNNCNFFSSSTK